MYKGKPHTSTPNTLDPGLDLEHTNQWWDSDITYIRSYEGFLFVAVAMDLYARNIVCCTMSSRMTDDLALSALTMVHWQRKPTNQLMLHSGQGAP